MLDYEKILITGKVLSVNVDNVMINVMFSIGTNRYAWSSTWDILTYNLRDMKYKLPQSTPCNSRTNQNKLDL